jgi:N-methylhydantoinase A
VTDANLALGKIDPAYFAGGKIRPDEAAASAALARAIGAPLGLDGYWPAAGVAEIVEENMANATRVHAIERAKDINACTMIAFGGSAPLHAASLAEKVGIRRIIVPPGAGVGSAIGFLRAPIAYEITRSGTVSLEDFDAPRINALLAQMTADALAVVKPAARGQKLRTQIIADARYTGQGHEVRLEVPARTLARGDGARLKSLFETLYAEIYNLTIPGQPAEIITWSVTVSTPQPKVKRVTKLRTQAAPKPRGRRALYDPALGRQVQAPVYWRFDMGPGARVKGPAIIAEDETSTIVGARYSAQIDSLGAIVLERVS